VTAGHLLLNIEYLKVGGLIYYCYPKANIMSQNHNLIKAKICCIKLFRSLVLQIKNILLSNIFQIVIVTLKISFIIISTHSRILQ